MPARDESHPGEVTIAGAATLWEAAEKIIARQVHELTVVEKNRIVGTISICDLLQATVIEGSDAAETRVRQLLRSTPAAGEYRVNAHTDVEQMLTSGNRGWRESGEVLSDDEETSLITWLELVHSRVDPQATGRLLQQDSWPVASPPVPPEEGSS